MCLVGYLEHLIAEQSLNNMNIEDEIKDKLGLKKFKKIPGTRGGGTINEGYAYEADDDNFLFVKRCTKDNAEDILTAELISLQAIRDTKTIRAPQPHCVVREPDGSAAVLVMEFIEMASLTKYQKECGQKLAELHLHNGKEKEKFLHESTFIGKHDNNADSPFVSKFGFEHVTFCGSIPLHNEWRDDWVSFFARNRLERQVSLLQENYGDRELGELWSQLHVVIPRFFRPLVEEYKPIQPCLLHGDMWSENACDSPNGPFVFDPACFYGHSEFDLCIGGGILELDTGGFRGQFYDEYFKEIHKEKGFEDWQLLYQVFHYMNHWNHFGGGYRSQTINHMKSLIRKVNL